MYRKASVQWKPLIISLLLTLGAGGLSAFLTGSSMEIYKTLVLPPLAPPPIVFPIVWTVLYVLMAISAYLIFISAHPARKPVLILYGMQLFVNILWPLIFFRLEAFLFAFIWLVLLWLLILYMVLLFSKINKTAAVLQIPYLLWVIFAGYLNLGIYLLNP